ncbi:MAG: hypothetical protein M1840_006547 [Geoglossum simile]|nr:MAG: hypothetical protein M1840_006547 [Geoglossum simile]
MNLPAPETRHDEVTQRLNGPPLSTPLAEGVTIQDSGGLEPNMADVEVNKDVEGSSRAIPDNDLEGQARAVDIESLSTKSMEQPLQRQYFGYHFPPQFHHHGQHSTPSSVDSPTGPQFPPPYNNPPLQHPHPQPSANTIPLRSYPDSSSSSPALQYPPHPPPGFIDPNFQPPFHSLGHQHRLSEPRVPFMNRPGNPNFNHRPDVFLPPRPGFPYAPQYHGRMPSFAPPEGYSPFPPGTPVGGENRGFLPPPPPQAPGPRVFPGPSYDHTLGPDMLQMPAPYRQQNAVSSSATSERNMPPQGELDESGGCGRQSSLFPLFHEQPEPDDRDGFSKYIEGQFHNPEYSDYVLELQHTEDRFKKAFYVHGVLIARSPTLKALMELAPPQSRSEKILRIETSDHFLVLDAFTRALQRLYGLPLLPIQKVVVSGDPPSRSYRTTGGHSLDEQTIQKQMEYALAYAAAGCLLQITAVARRGVETASLAIAWETIEKALDFAMEGGLGVEWTSGHSTSVSPASSRRSVSVEGSQVGSASTSSLDSPQDTSEALPLGSGGGTYAPYADHLLQQVLNFIVEEFPANFALDTTAPQFTYRPRLPMEINLKPTTNPLLSSMKFGDNPTEDDIKRSNLSTTVLSSTLLSLPFPILKHILESTKLGRLDGWASATLRQKVARDVVDERERRRREIRGRTNISKEERAVNSKAWENVGWEESVVIEYSGQSSGVNLRRRWKGFTH